MLKPLVDACTRWACILHAYAGVLFELWHETSGKLVRRYPTEGAALAFLRDVVRVGGRQQAAEFRLEQLEDTGESRTLASGEVLVQRSLEDRAE